MLWICCWSGGWRWVYWSREVRLAMYYRLVSCHWSIRPISVRQLVRQVLNERDTRWRIDREVPSKKHYLPSPG